MFYSSVFGKKKKMEERLVSYFIPIFTYKTNLVEVYDQIICFNFIIGGETRHN